MRAYIFTTIFTIVFGIALGQDFTVLEHLATEEEAVTARSMGLAGAFGAVGADFSNATSNPAGMAFFRKIEIGLGLGLRTSDVLSSYLNQNSSGDYTAIQFNNLGLNYSRQQTEWIGDSLAVKKTGLVSWSIAIGMNNKADLHERIRLNGFNQSNTLATSYMQSANQFAYSDLNSLDVYESQAYQVGILDTVSHGNYYGYTSDYSSGQLQQSGEVNRNGQRRDYFLSGGLNYSNKLYLGATIDVVSLGFEEQRYWKETDVSNVYNTMDYIDVLDDKQYKGIGGILSVGGIYRFSDYFRMGAHIKTSSSLDMKQWTSINTMLKNNTWNQQDAEYTHHYYLEIPFRTGLQMVASHPQYGLLSLEGDFINYANSQVNYYEDEYGDLDTEEDQFKQDVKTYYKGTFNFRGGVEARVLKDFRLRGGLGYYGSPWRNEEDELGADYSKLTMALGLGYRHEPSNLVFDLGFNHTESGEFNTAYIVNNSAMGAISEKRVNLFRLNISKRFNQ